MENTYKSNMLNKLDYKGSISKPNNGIYQQKSSQAVRVFVVEPFEFMREAMCYTLDSLPNIEIIGSSANGVTSIDEILDSKPEVILSASEVESGLFELLTLLKTSLPSVSVIMFNKYPSDSIIQRALLAGCRGIINAAESVENISKAISEVKAGSKYFSPAFKHRIISNRQGSGNEMTSRKSLLSPREIEVLCCVAQGMKAKKIASMLEITAKTVERHKSNIMAKLGLASQVDLAIYAVKEGYIQV